jgi:hypothetical protein
MSFEPSVFDPVLSSNEGIVWTGRPHFVPYLLTGLPFLVIGCLWGAFDFQFIRHMPASQMGFALPFFALHLFPFWGSILYMVYLAISYRNVVYAISNQRVMVRAGAFAPSFKSYDFRDIDQLSVSSGPFESMVGAGSVKFSTGKTTSKGAVIYETIRGVDGAYDVFKQLRETWEKSRGTSEAAATQGS